MLHRAEEGVRREPSRDRDEPVVDDEREPRAEHLTGYDRLAEPSVEAVEYNVRAHAEHGCKRRTRSRLVREYQVEADARDEERIAEQKKAVDSGDEALPAEIAEAAAEEAQGED